MSLTRPYLAHFFSVETPLHVAISAGITLSQRQQFSYRNAGLASFDPVAPFRSIGLLRSNSFKMKVQGLDVQGNIVFQKSFESDHLGNFDIKILKPIPKIYPIKLKILETNGHPGLEFYLGSFIPMIIDDQNKILISDFDKTLVDTRYSTTKDVYHSLTRPLEYFPSLSPSMEIFQDCLKKGFHPFIVTASPHFYEDAIRDWFHQNKITNAPIFLKDYRKIISFLNDELTAKDIKTQGHYKIHQIIRILIMTGVPRELVLIGDGLESDAIIYTSLAALLTQKIEPFPLWKRLKDTRPFRLNTKQSTQFLNKLYQLDTMIKKVPYSIKLHIHIRVIKGQKSIPWESALKIENMPLMTFYEA